MFIITYTNVHRPQPGVFICWTPELRDEIVAHLLRLNDIIKSVEVSKEVL